MGIFKKYFDQEDKKELYLRQQQINQQILIVEGLQQMLRNFVVSKFSKYGLDGSKQWSVNPLTGQIKEIKPEPPKK